MPWFRVDDRFWQHPKVTAIPADKRLRAAGLWSLAGSYCAANLTDGRINDAQIRMVTGLDRRATGALTQLLLDANLWEKDGEFYCFRNWADYQPTREAIEIKREKERLKKQKQRMSPGDNKGSPAGPLDPYPTRPDPVSLSKDKHVGTASAVRAVFDFWVAETGRNPKQVKLTDQRRKKIQARLREGYTSDQLKDAIRGAKSSPFHRGENDSGSDYLWPETIFRDGGTVEKHIERLGPQKPQQTQAEKAQELERLKTMLHKHRETYGAEIIDQNFKREISRVATLEAELGGAA